MSEEEEEGRHVGSTQRISERHVDAGDLYDALDWRSRRGEKVR
jgi:hypothetical protein